MPALSIVSYNVHRAVGRDRRCQPERILGVLREIDGDIVALQEVEAGDSGAAMLAWLAKETGFHYVAGTTLIRHDGHYGNGLLSRLPIRHSSLCDLSWRGGRKEQCGNSENLTKHCSSAAGGGRMLPAARD